MTRDGIRRQLQALGTAADADIDLGEAALLLAALAHPRAALDPYRRHLERLAEEVAAQAERRAGPPDLARKADALRSVIARRYGYGAAEESYTDPDGADLMRVIDRRQGVATALGILYLATARRLGWEAEAVGFPVRLLVRLGEEGRRVLLDPFDGGREVDSRHMRDLYKAAAGNQAELTPADYAALDNRAVLLRLGNRIKAHHLREQHLSEALEQVETLLLLAPDSATLWREAGLIHAKLENIKAAIAALEEYLRRDNDGPARERTSQLLLELRGRLH